MKNIYNLIALVPTIFCVSCASNKNEIPTFKSLYGDHHGKISIRTTAYTHTESDHRKYKRKSAVGTTLNTNNCAADWSIFPVGTVLKIGGKIYTVNDYGSALIKDKKAMPVVDIYQPSKKAMNAWGVKYFDDVQVLHWGSFSESVKILSQRLSYAHCRTMYQRIISKI